MKKNKFIIILIIGFLIIMSIVILTWPKKNKEKNSYSNNYISNGNSNSSEDVYSNVNNNTDINTTNNNNTDVIVGKNDGKYGTFVEYKGNVYYWKLDEDSRESSALYGNYAGNANHLNSLIKKSSDGKESIVLQDTGNGEIFIVNDKIYYNKQIIDGEIVCVSDLNGENQNQYNFGKLKFVQGDYVYIEADNYIDSINSVTDEGDRIVEATQVLGVAEDKLFYAKADKDSIGFGYVYNNKDSGLIYKFSKSRFGDDSNLISMMILDYEYSNGSIKIDIGNVQGTGYFVQQAFSVQMNTDGSDVMVTENSDYYSESYSVSQKFSTIVKITDEGLEFKNPSTSKSEVILTNSDLTKKIGINKSTNGIYTIYSADLINTELYIVLDVGEYNAEDDLGWREAYKRQHTVAFKYNISNKSIVKIYEF